MAGIFVSGGVGDVTQAELTAVETDLTGVSGDVTTIQATLVAANQYTTSWPSRPACVVCIYQGPTAQQANITDDEAGDIFVSTDGA